MFCGRNEFLLIKTFRASLKTLIVCLRQSGLTAYNRNPLVNGFLEEPLSIEDGEKKIAPGKNIKYILASNF